MTELSGWQAEAVTAARAEPTGDENLVVCASYNETDATREFIFVRVGREKVPGLVEMLMAAYRGGRFQYGPLDGVRFDPGGVIHNVGDEMVMSATDDDGLAPVYRVVANGDAEHVGFKHTTADGQPTVYIPGKEPATTVASSTTVGTTGKFFDLDEYIERGAMMLVTADAKDDALFRIEVPEDLQRSRWTRADEVTIWDDVTAGGEVDITPQVQELARSMGWTGPFARHG
jgi:hypothetical protein